MLRLILAAFTVYRLAQMIVFDTGPFGVFERLKAWAGRNAAGKKKYGFAWTLAEGLNCPFCLGVWLSAPVWLLVRSKSRWSGFVLGVLGISGMQAYLEGASHGRSA